MGCLIILTNTCHIRISMWVFKAAYWLKIIIINFFVEIIMRYYFGEEAFFALLRFSCMVIWAAIIPFWWTYACSDGLVKAFCMIWLGDGVGFVVISVVDLFADLILNDPGKEAIQTLGWHTLFVAVFAVIYLFALPRIGKKWFEKIRERKIKHKKLWMSLFALYCIISILITFNTSLVEGNGLMQSYFMTVVLIIALVVGIILYQRIEQKHLYSENQNLQHQQRLMEEYYTTLSEQMKLTAKLRHDIANHIQTLERLIELKEGNVPEMASYAGELRCQYEQLIPMNFCKNIVIDAVLCNKAKICSKEEIKANIQIHSIEIGNISEVEILGILYNLFDNAIESCRKINKNENPFLDFICDNISSQLVMKMRNNVSTIKMDKGRFLTTKKENEFHGVGLSIIEDIVKKHNGSVKYQVEEGIFEIMIVMEIDI